MKKNIIVSLVFILTLCSCHRLLNSWYTTLELANDSEHSIIVYWALGNHPEGTEYPDTILTDAYFREDSPTDTSIIYNLVQSGNKEVVRLDGFEVEDYFALCLDEDTLSVFVIHGDTALTRPWKDIKDENNYIVRYDLSYNDYVNLKECIPFPPTEAMRDMKMWPPYEEVRKRYDVD